MSYKTNERKGFLPQGVPLLWGITALLAVVNAALFFGIFFSSQGIPGYQHQCRQIAELEEKVKTLQEENSRLFEKIQGLKNDPLAQEKLVRQRLGWTRPNELVIEFGSPGAERSPH